MSSFPSPTDHGPSASTPGPDPDPGSIPLVAWSSPNGAYGYEIHRPAPRVLVGCPWGDGTLEDVEIYSRHITRLIEEHAPDRTVIVLDYGHLHRVRPEARRIFIHAINAVRPMPAGLVFVRLNPIMRLFVRLGRRMSNYPFPVRIETSREAGIRAAIALIEHPGDDTRPLPPRRRAVRRFLPDFLTRRLAHELMEDLADFPWDSRGREPFPVAPSHPFHEIFEMWGTVKDDLDLMEAARRRHEADLDLAVQALGESEHRYRAVFEASGAAMLLFGDDHLVRMANKAALRMSGRLREQLESGFDWTTLVHPDDLPRLLDHHARRRLDPNLPSRCECRFLGDAGQERIASVTIELVPGTSLRVASLDDLTETRRAEAEIVRLARSLEGRVLERTTELEMANQRLAEALRSREEFLASMSHELRTPLASILNLSESLLSGVYGGVTPAQAKAVSTVGTNGQHLLDLITDILDLSKSQAGMLELRKVTMSLSEAIQDATAMIRPNAEARDIHLVVEIDHDHDLLEADPRRVRQMVVNLLSNAVKFTPPGKRIGVRSSLSPLAGSLRIEVWDEGIGIAPGSIELLFQPFVQLDNRLSREHSGTGLGLSLTRSLAELHQGTIGVSSVEGIGSTFRIDLPRGRHDDRTSVREDSEGSAGISDEALRILVIEDNADLRGVLADYLEAAGNDVLCADNGGAGLAILAAEPVDIVLLDVQMPGMDGFEVLRRVRARLEWADLPVIAMTGLAFEEDARRCRDAGATLHVAKPLRMAELLKILRSLHAKSRSPER